MVGTFIEAAVSGHVELVVAHTELDYLRHMLLRRQTYDAWTRVAAVGKTSTPWTRRFATTIWTRSSPTLLTVSPDSFSTNTISPWSFMAMTAPLMASQTCTAPSLKPDYSGLFHR
jgi:hypothetical protein